jgi:NTE family protein
MTYGLVLGAGGTAGEAFHRGVVRGLQDLGLDARRAEVVVGTSAGSIVAASLRRHATTPPVAAPAAGPVRRRLLPRRTTALEFVRRPRQVLNAALLAPEFASGRISADFLQQGLAGRHAAWPEAGLYVVAVRRRDGKRVVFGAPGEPRPDVGAAVAASCAIPGYFSAVEIDGDDFVDGGVHSPTNADVLGDQHLDLVVISSPMSVALRSPAVRLDLGLRLLFHGYLLEEVWTLRRRGARVVAIEPDRAVLAAMGLNMMDGRGMHEVEERAYELARRRLHDIPLELAVRRA